MKYIAVYCGASVGNHPVYTEAAKNLARLLFEQQIGIVYGGGNIGLMGVMADEMIALGGEIIGVIPQLLVEREVAHKNLTELHIVKDMHERKATMFKLSDGVIAMPGGIGTMEELFEAFTWSQLGIHHLPCGVYNVNGYYDLFESFLNKMVNDHFLKPDQRQMLLIDSDPKNLLLRMFK